MSGDYYQLSSYKRGRRSASGGSVSVHNKWVRPLSPMSAAATAVPEQQQQHHYQPILKGPRPQYNATSWKRQRVESNDTSDDVAVPGNGLNDDMDAPAITVTTTTTSMPQIHLQKVGRHKLVQTKQSKIPPDHEADLKERILQKLKRKGRNKLILADSKKVTVAATTMDPAATIHPSTTSVMGMTNPTTHSSDMSSLPDAAAAPTVAVPQTMKRKGIHKLVTRSTKQPANPHVRQRPNRQLVGSTPKRVKLNAKRSEHERLDTSSPATVVPPKRLTDFCYTTASERMTLVRVRPDVETTPICPTFMRGIPCTNPKCAKRHDVPLEAATPICSFFQHQGQCHKGTACPFRHVKVNPQATMCPSFSLLGFCQDADCTMKHVRPHRKVDVEQ